MVKHPLNIFESHLPDSIVIRSLLLTAGEKIALTLKTIAQRDEYYSFRSDMHVKSIPN